MVRDLLVPDDPHATVSIESTAARGLGHRPEPKPCPFMLVRLPQILASVGIVQPK